LRYSLSFAASGTCVVSMLASAAVVVYPDVLPAVDPSRNLTIDEEGY
jgi:hypothetical protein